MAKSSAEPLAALDIAVRELKHRWIVLIGNRERYVASALMRSLFVIMRDHLLDEMPEMLLAADHEVIETLGSQRLNEPFRVGVHVRCQRADPLDLSTLRLEHGVEVACTWSRDR